MRLLEQPCTKGDPDPKALACYGVLWQQGGPDEPDRSQAWLRFVTGRPVSAITTQFLEWCCRRLLKDGKTNWLLISSASRIANARIISVGLACLLVGKIDPPAT